MDKYLTLNFNRVLMVTIEKGRDIRQQTARRWAEENPDVSIRVKGSSLSVTGREISETLADDHRLVSLMGQIR